MLKYSLKLTGILIGLLSVVSAFGASHNQHFLWKVSSADHTLYVAGITQLLKKSDYPLPAVFDNAFKKSDTLILEGEGPNADREQARKLIMQYGVFSHGKTLMSDVSASAKVRLKRTAKQLQIPLQELVQLKPWYAALTIGQIARVRRGISPKQSMLMHFYQKAEARGLPLVALESNIRQVKYFSGLSKRLQVQWLRMKEADVQHLKNQRQKILNAWRQGKTKALAKTLARGFKGKPALRKALVTTRNTDWFKKLKQRLHKQRGPAFVIVGAGHLVGPRNLLDLFRQAGYTIAQQ